MFFNRHIKQGKQLGNTTLQMITSASLGSAINSDGDFDPPEDFYKDSYIAGFVLNVVGLGISFGLGGASWASTKKGECTLYALNEIDTSGDLKKALLRQMPLDEALLEKGLQDGATVMGLTYQKLKADDPDPKVVEAKKLAKDLTTSMPNNTYNENLATAALAVTLREYIQGKWS